MEIRGVLSRAFTPRRGHLYSVLALGFSLVLLAILALTGFAMNPTGAAANTSQGGPSISKEARPETCPGSWATVSSPTLGAGLNVLEAVDAVSPVDIWAVGSYSLQSNSPRITLIEHWDGTQWSVVPSPNPGSGYNTLFGVEAISATEAWAVGTLSDTQAIHPLLLRWNGSAWTQVTLPVIGGGLADVTAIAPSDVWAVGTLVLGNGPLTMHWDGNSWSVVPAPHPGPGRDIITGVSGAASNDVWAVGYEDDQAMSVDRTFIIHWDGSTWSVVSSPNTSFPQNFLYGVAAIASNDVWAAGYATDSTAQPIIMHWDGMAWSITQELMSGIFLNDITAASANDVWAAGSWDGYNHAASYHWDGAQWIMIPGQDIGADVVEFRGVTVVSTYDVWAVGDYTSAVNGQLSTLVEHYSDVCPTPTNTRPTSTPTSTNTATSTQPTATRTGTPTATPLPSSTVPPGYCGEFEDVPSSRPDYQEIQCSSCQGFMEAYQCGQIEQEPCVSPDNRPYYRPDVKFNAIRAEIAKKLCLAAGYTESPGPPVFEDVPPDNPYYPYVNRLANRSILSGYPCGGVGEPCVPPKNRPYFRPNTADVRGQFAQQLSDAAGLLGIASGVYYADVLEDNPYYIWIMRLTNANLISGYPCGGPGEPCDEHNRPYFRPFATFSPTRAQMAVYGSDTFYPNCQINPPTPTITVTASVTSTGTRTRTRTALPTQTTGSPSTTSVPTNTNTPTHAPTGTTAPTQTPGGPSATTTTPPTNTPTPPTDTPTAATPTACTLQYTDVPPESTFYPFVRCLACRGIISGYGCGGVGEPCDQENNPYFRPNINVTRGQIAKIVSNSAGFEEDPGPQIYEDVDPADTFYQWINRLSSRSYMGGYPCGTVPEEPCNPPENRPYFRPFANATRGQLAKIVSNAAGFSDPPGEQIFTDVPPEQSFYVWVQRLASRGIMGGYPCGSLGEPCDSENRSYFRPFNNVTRGQTSKIVSGAFFPDCRTLSRR